MLGLMITSMNFLFLTNTEINQQFNVDVVYPATLEMVLLCPTDVDFVISFDEYTNGTLILKTFKIVHNILNKVIYGMNLFSGPVTDI